MKQVRARLHLKLNAIDVLLDNTLLPLLACMALVAYLWESFK
jgi:hypothetical protein